MKTRIAIVAGLIGVLAYFAYVMPVNVQKEIEKGPMISPNAMNRIRLPIPWPTPAMEQIVKANDEQWMIDCKPVVLSRQDQRTIMHAQMRKIYGIHE